MGSGLILRILRIDATRRIGRAIRGRRGSRSELRRSSMQFSAGGFHSQRVFMAHISEPISKDVPVVRCATARLLGQAPVRSCRGGAIETKADASRSHSVVTHT